MPVCCPSGRGCNSPGRDELCVLELCRSIAAEEPRAAHAVDRWEQWLQSCDGGLGRRERRFRRRAYERARDEAVAVLLMRLAIPERPRRHRHGPAQPVSDRDSRRARRHRPSVARRDRSSTSACSGQPR